MIPPRRVRPAYSPRTFVFVLSLACMAFVFGNSAVAAPCGIKPQSMPARPLHYRAVVQGVATKAEVASQTQIAIARSGAPMSPKYLDLPRIDAEYIADGVKHSTIAAVIDGRIPPKGEMVELASRYRDPDQPCSFIPWTVVPNVAWH